ESAMGACVLAAAGRLGGVWAAAEQMARVERVFEPAAGRGTVCGEVYGRWVEALKRRGYL
ncbi:MAG TPA: carbohydrate kinase, partial [Candidatus Brocadiia bacterium]|nr:carbohydrate kinase [Candidatus Brocadiia bacterium]